MSVAPRINSTMLHQYVGKPVRIVGTVQGYDDSKQIMTIVASDGMPVSVMVAAQNVGVVWESGQILEVIGAAQGNPAPTMMEYTSIPFAKGFDLANYEKLVQLIQHKYQHLFQ